MLCQAGNGEVLAVLRRRYLSGEVALQGASDPFGGAALSAAPFGVLRSPPAGASCAAPVSPCTSDLQDLQSLASAGSVGRAGWSERETLRLPRLPPAHAPSSHLTGILTCLVMGDDLTASAARYAPVYAPQSAREDGKR